MLVMASIIYLFLFFLCRVADDFAFRLYLIWRPHAIVVTGVTFFFGVLILTHPG